MPDTTHEEIESQPAVEPAVPASAPKLRPYQVELVNDLYRELNEGYKRVAIIAGTGAGKTIISGQICAHAEEAGKRLMFLVHLDVLVGQTYEKMKAFGLQCGFIKAGWEENRDAPIQIASIQTMAKRRWWQKWPADVVFYDEGHITLFSQVGKKVMLKTHANAVHLVMTATPLRLGKEQLGDYLETLVSSPVPSVLQDMGYLSQMKYYSMPRDSMANLEEVKTARGDYDERDLKNACDRTELVEKIVEEWFRIGHNKRTIAFCVDIDHANHVAEQFRKILAEIRRKRRRHPNEKWHGFWVAKFGRCVFDVLRANQHLFGDGDNSFPEGCQTRLCAGANKQIQAQLVFQFPDLVGQCRLRYMTDISRTAKTSQFRNRCNIFKVSQIHQNSQFFLSGT